MSFRSLRQGVHAIALGVAILVALFVPSVFGLVSHSYEAQQLAFKANLSAAKLAKYIFTNERLWQYQRVRLAEIIEFNSIEVDLRQSVQDVSGHEIVAVGSQLQTPLLSKSAAIVVGGRIVGHVVATQSLGPLIGRVDMMAIASMALALACYVGVRTLPLKALDRTLGSLEAAHGELVQVNERLGTQADQLRDAQRLGRIGHWRFDAASSAFEWSDEALALIGDHQSDGVREPSAVLALCSAGSREGLAAVVRRLRASRTVEQVDIKFQGPDGTYVDLSVVAHIDCKPDGTIVGYSGTIQDISERKRAEEQLEQLAFYDPLTGLANRSLFRRALESLVTASATGSKSGALLLIDLDHFKEVNDTLGHGAGDEMLVEVVRRIQSVLDRVRRHRP